MASAATPAVAGRLPLSRLADLVLPLGIMASVLVILVPLPPHLLDVLLSANITVAVVVLLTTIYVRTPLEFSIFPTVLLATTLARLVLNVATTRLILTQAQTQGLWAAGGVVKGFGEFVAGDKVIVGLVIFAILVVIQFVVITKGATRISEVAARFALDGMPGRQMAIDADLNAGLIDQQEAQRRRQEVAQQADFFGAMDGASKFVRGDAVAGILITLVNIVGGLAIGVLQAGLSVTDAGSLYTKLTIGDGLVTQIPALLISLSAGLLVTRSSRSTDLPREFMSQLFSRPQVLVVAAGFLSTLIFTSLPRVPLTLLGLSCVGLAWFLSKRQKAEIAATAAQQKAVPKAKDDERIENFLAVDPMEIEVGLGLVRLADPPRGGDLLARIQRLRQTIAAEVGILVPKVRIRDNMALDKNRYRIKIANAVVAEGTIYPGQWLATDAGGVAERIAGRAGRDPITQAPAVWIDATERRRAESLGYATAEAAAVLAAHLTDTIRLCADEILTRDATRHLLEELKRSQPAVIDELIPGLLKLSDVQQVLQILLREQVSIRQLGVILEALGDHAAQTKDPAQLAEFARQRLARALTNQHRGPDGVLRVAILHPSLEDRIAAVASREVGTEPREGEAIVDMVIRSVAPQVHAGTAPVVLVNPRIRAALKKLLQRSAPRLAVLSYDDVTRDTPVESTVLIGESSAGSESEPNVTLERFRGGALQVGGQSWN
ncbi:MAG: flagellar biosynthesis protein FlhA [Planctomycetia bacterium]|nr:flagellar biosynthesis protein FlhA [Planctomycetia bacterium]